MAGPDALHEPRRARFRLRMTVSSSSVDARLSGRQAAFLVLLVALCRVLAVHSCPTYDDAFITFRYAENLARGLGLVFNPGEDWEPVLGTTTPAYALTLAGFARLGAGLESASLVLNVLFDMGSAACLLLLLERRAVVATVTLTVFAATPEIARIAVGGMEVPLFALCLLSACLASQSRRPLLAGTAAALACSVRPEGVLSLPIVAWAWIRERRSMLTFLLPVAVIGGVAVWLLQNYYGSAVPHSVTAKGAMHAAKDWPTTLERWRDILSQAFLPNLYYFPALPLVAVGLVRALRGAPGLRRFSTIALAISASYLAARPHTWGWYYYVALCAWSIWLGLGMESLAAALERRLGQHFGTVPRGRAGLHSVALGSLGLVALGAVYVTTRGRPDRVTPEVYEAMRQWAVSEGIDRRPVRVMASDIGIVGRMTPGSVLDSAGLIWPPALEYDIGVDPYKAQMLMVVDWEPDYLVLVARYKRVAALRERPDLAHYVPVARFNALGIRNLEPALEDLPQGWVQDYLVYRRKGP